MATPTTSSARKPLNNNSSPISTPIFKSLRKLNWKNRFTSTKTPLRFTPNNSAPPSDAAAPHTPIFDLTTKKVTLLDWWLIKVQVKAPNHFTLGVGGNAFDGQASMYFSSGEILTRHDEMTLETVDRITITLASLLNRSRTLENGFPSQACDHFFLGFPFDWEEFGAKYFGEQSIHGGRSSKAARMPLEDIDDPECLLSSLDDIPVTRLFDHMMVSSGDHNECPLTRAVFDHILSEYGSSSAKLYEENTDQIRAEDSLPNETRTPLHVRAEYVRSGVLTRSKAGSKKPKTDPADITAECNVTAEESAIYPVQTKKISGPCPTSEAENSEKDASSRHATNKFPYGSSSAKLYEEDTDQIRAEDYLPNETRTPLHVRAECVRSGVLTRSKAGLKNLKSDPADITAKCNVTAAESAIYPVQTKKTSDPCPTSEAENSEKDASSRHATNKFPKVIKRVLDMPGVRRSSRKRNAVL